MSNDAPEAMPVLCARERIDRLSVATILLNFINQEVLPGTGLTPVQFWNQLQRLLIDFVPLHRNMLEQRHKLQLQIDAWHAMHRSDEFDESGCRRFLSEIGYLVPDGPVFSIRTTNVDPELASVAGPQLIVPVMNSRYAINSANARWGSLYGALYGDINPSGRLPITFPATPEQLPRKAVDGSEWLEPACT